MCDFDPETQLALAYTFPDSSIKGFWFYYTDAVLKYMKCIRVQWDRSRSNTTSCLRMLMVLPLLPAEYMAPGLQSIRNWAQEKSAMNASIEKLCSFIEQDWFRSVGADKMSIFGLPHGVYNYVQHFNNEFRQSLINSQQQQSIWHILGKKLFFQLKNRKKNRKINATKQSHSLLECITHLATRTYMKCKKRQNSFDSKPNRHHKVLETIIKNATQMWCSDPIHLRNPLQFLQLSSHCINDAYMEASQSHFSVFLEHKINAGTDHEDRHFNLSKSNLSKKNKSLTNEKCKKNFAINSPELNTDPVEETFVTCVQVTTKPNVKSHIVNKSEPPPLAFFPKNRGQTQKPIIFSATEPPPLVPITRNFA